MGTPLSGKPLIQLEASFPPGQRCFEALLTCYIHEAFLVGRAGGFDGVVDIERGVEGGTHALDFVSPVQSFFGVAHEVRVDDGNVPGDLEGRGEMLALGDDARDDAEGEGAL